MAIRAIFFDLDGTIIDSEPSAALVLERCFRQWGVALDPEDTSYLTGRTWDSALSFIFKKYKITESQPETSQKVLAQYREQIEKELFVVPGSVQAVQLLATRYPLALISGSRKSDIQWALTKLGIIQHFQIILGAEDYPRSKPAPDGYLKAAQILSQDPKECLVFEDSSAGIASARSAGMPVVAVTCTNHFKQDVSLSIAQISNFEGLNLPWIEQLQLPID